MMFYAGIGSRRTPEEYRMKMRLIASTLEYNGWHLNSGGAPGPDSWFEEGVHNPSNKSIFPPWPGFEGRPMIHPIPEEAYHIAAAFHPRWKFLSGPVQDMMARNAMQILGKNVASPVSFALCYTPDGCEHQKDRSAATGGTGQAISIASAHGVPVINMRNPGWSIRLGELTELEFSHIEHGSITTL